VGIESQAIRLLLLAREMGADFSRSLTIGRQDLLITASDLRSIMADFGIRLPVEEAQTLAKGRNRFAEPLLERLGAETVDSLDASSFEGATIIHDLNEPPEPSMAERFSLVIDAGTLEHVFNVPTALATMMSVVRKGGHLLLAHPANNEMGHGLYQFSPDFYFRTLAPENGYRVKALFLAEIGGGPQWLAVRDPAAVRARVGFNVPRGPQYIFVIAERIEVVQLFSKPPQQSDYAAEWKENQSKGVSEERLAFFDRAIEQRSVSERSIRHKIVAHAPQTILRPLRWLRAGRQMDLKPDPSQMQPFLAKGGFRPPSPV
jgi:SAM-dependent methyltransferase